jgi:putative ABC transport system permease protein
MRFAFSWRMLLRSVLVRRSRSFTALAAVAIAATVATALLNLYFDTQSKLTREFRRFGANVVIQGNDIDPMQVQAKLQPAERFVPYAFATAESRSGPIVIVGTDLDELLKLNDFWKRELNPSMKSLPINAVLGARAYERAIDSRSEYPTLAGEIMINGNPIPIAAIAKVTTGDANDSRIFVPLKSLLSLAPDSKVTVIEIAVPSTPAEIDRRVAELRNQLPQFRIEPVRQIVATQASVLTRMRSVLLLSTALIAIIAAISLLASLSASVLERRRDFAVFKALGASQTSVSGMFLAEALAIGLAGALLGYLLGCAVSALIGYVNFHSAVRPRIAVLPWIATGSLLITLLGALLPLQRLQKIQPAAMLKGE